jgi:hypothetical protein
MLTEKESRQRCGKVVGRLRRAIQNERQRRNPSKTRIRQLRREIRRYAAAAR